MMSVAFAALGESAAVCVISRRVKQLSGRAVASDAVTRK
jgi:hypothetical protein